MQSRKCIEDVIHFAWEEKVFLLADEVRAVAAVPSCPHTGRAQARSNVLGVRGEVPPEDEDAQRYGP